VPSAQSSVQVSALLLTPPLEEPEKAPLVAPDEEPTAPLLPLPDESPLETPWPDELSTPPLDDEDEDVDSSGAVVGLGQPWATTTAQAKRTRDRMRRMELPGWENTVPVP
jgi:hypothetical protein